MVDETQDEPMAEKPDGEVFKIGNFSVTQSHIASCALGAFVTVLLS